MKNLIILFFLTGFTLRAQDTLYIQVPAEDFFQVEWANHHIQFAYLINDTIHICQVKNGGYTETQTLSLGIKIRAFTWDVNDKALIVSTYEEENYERQEWRVYLRDGSKEQISTSLGAYYGLYGLDHNGKYLAVYSVGEGHPDITIYDRKLKEILSTDVYPGSIDMHGWEKGWLYVTSDMPLEKGLTRDARGEEFIEPGEAYHTFKINPKTGVAVKVNALPSGIGMVSHNGKYILVPE